MRGVPVQSTVTGENEMNSGYKAARGSISAGGGRGKQGACPATDDLVAGKQGGFLEEGAFELRLERWGRLWQMEVGVAWGPSVPRLGGRNVPGAFLSVGTHESLHCLMEEFTSGQKGVSTGGRFCPHGSLGDVWGHLRSS